MSINNLYLDSRQVRPNGLFAAIKGSQANGHDYIAAALGKGATAILMDRAAAGKLKDQIEKHPDVAFLMVENPAVALGQMASAFFGHPSKTLKVVATTGTNGKTTTVFLQQQLFEALGYRTGLLSTIENRIGDKVVPTRLTTPDAISIQRLLAEMVAAGATHCFMEASSHAIVQERIAGIHFAGAIFTNISHDHLDYHGSFAEYIKAKKQLFDRLPANAFALVNADDRRSAIMLQNCPAAHHRFALKQMADFKAKILGDTAAGLQLEIDGKETWFRLLGNFNAYNLLGVYASAVLLGEEPHETLRILSGLQAAKGRFEQMASADGVKAIVDYAHTPDALENVLKTLTAIRQQEKLITVVGCGGNRDKTKRPLMASIAAKYSDYLILTSDNPRDEAPEDIIKDMEAGLTTGASRYTTSITDRAEAIATACGELAQAGDLVLIAGKGHETYQEVAGQRHHFDDREFITTAFQQRKVTKQTSG